MNFMQKIDFCNGAYWKLDEIPDYPHSRMIRKIKLFAMVSIFLLHAKEVNKKSV